MPPKSKVADKGGFGIKLDSERIYLYLLKRREGMSISRAAREAGMSRSSANRIERGDLASPEWRQAKAMFDETHPKEVVADDHLSPEARRALNDFDYFRRRYFGRVSVPWAVHTAHLVAEKLETPEKEFLLCNAPPSIGKSTFWTMDLPAWLICRNRAIRIMLGAGGQSISRQYAQQLRREFERDQPMRASDDDKKKGLAVDAEATLVDDFGTFKPPRGEAWTADDFVVRQVGDVMKGKKEPTVSAYGADSTFIGHRVDIAIWDDLVTNKNTLNPETRERLKNWYPKYAESRVEPGGCMILQGQRLHAEDLYHDVAEIEITEFSDADDTWGDPIGQRKKYVHIKYKAHYDEYCQDVHHPRDAVPFDPDDPTGSGCLIDPKRLTYRELMSIRDQDNRNYVVTYQQEDMDPAQVLVNPMWVNGGRDPETGEEHPGCWDRDRIVGDVSSLKHLPAPWLSVVTADPSPTKYWSIQWWIFHPETEQRFLIDHARQSMGANDFLDLLSGTDSYVGLLEDWWQRAKKTGKPITHVIVERNAAQRFLLQYDFVKNWQRVRGVRIVAHDTYTNKTDPKFGVQATLPQQYRFGRVRLPAGDATSKGRSMALVNEVTKWPESSTDDALMSQWFLEFNVSRLRREIESSGEPPRMKRPSWMGGKR